MHTGSRYIKFGDGWVSTDLPTSMRLLHMQWEQRASEKEYERIDDINALRTDR